MDKESIEYANRSFMSGIYQYNHSINVTMLRGDAETV